ncbi:MAG: hypothetical protein N3A38_14270, partial [Planctomycetota bacterium]|nr:hypothetical protein [Planctomycetota bacterium]
MAGEGRTNYLLRAVEGPEYAIDPPNPSVEWREDLRNRTIVEIGGLAPGDYVYVAVKGQEDVKHVVVRVLPYAVEELRVLVKAAILARMYEESVK